MHKIDRTMPSSRKKRVLLLGDASQIHLARWERYLRESDFDTMTVSLEPVATIDGPRQRVRIPSILPPFTRYPMAVPFVRRSIKRFEPDVINAHFLPNYGVIAMMTAFRPWILSTWGSDIMLLPDKTPFHLMRTKRVLAAATAVTSDAEVMTQRLIELGTSPDRVVTFPMGVDRRVFHPACDRGGTGPRIFSSRKLEAVYDVQTIVAAFPSVVKQEPDATLTIAGKGDLASKIREMAARTVPGGSVRFVGHVEHKRLPRLLGENDIYVSMSRSDTTSVSLLEAMACGLFPIVSNIPANAEWINDGENGVLVPVGDAARLTEAIVEAWRHPERRETAARLNGKLIASRADWQENMEVFVRLLDRILGAE